MLAALILVCLVLSAGVSRYLGGWGVVVMAGMSVLWLAGNGPMEGAVLVEITPTHGITAADLAGVAGLCLAVVQWISWYRSGPTT